MMDTTSHKQYVQELNAYEDKYYIKHLRMIRMKQTEEMISDFIELTKHLDKTKSIEFCPVTMYQAFYRQHKEANGSYKHLLREGGYDKKMQEREDYVWCCINEVIESRLDYEKKAREEYYEHLKLHDYLESLDEMK